ncbi:MAG: hypothetical protein AAF467_14090 [Actinomycetota bacterium]
MSEHDERTAELHHPLPDHVDPDLVAQVVHGITKGHDIAARAYNDVEGWDGHCYGTVAWRLSWFQVEAHLEVRDDVKTSRPGGMFRIWHDGTKYTVYTSGSTDPNWSVFSYDFERSNGRIEVARSNHEQLTIFAEVATDTLDEPVDDEVFRELSFVYVGAADHGGCVAVYLGAPVGGESGEKTWGWVRQVYGGPSEGGFSGPNGDISPSKFGPHGGLTGGPSIEIALEEPDE